jgi:hypothetical protein
VERRQQGQLDHPNAQESGGRDEEGVGPLARDTVEGGIDFPVGVGIQYLNLQAHGASSSFHITQRRFGTRCIVRIEEHCNACNPGHKLTQEFQPFCH